MVRWTTERFFKAALTHSLEEPQEPQEPQEPKETTERFLGFFCVSEARRTTERQPSRCFPETRRCVSEPETRICFKRRSQVCFKKTRAAAQEDQKKNQEEDQGPRC